MGFEGSVATRARPNDVNVVAACGICRPDLHGNADPGRSVHENAVVLQG
jgi:D-arabinose 1-dehydrogenase-like Zn-dependent alcohol dehydrogenase